MKSSPTSTASTGLCRCTFGNPGIAPNNTSSMLGCVAAVIETESPSQPRPAVIQTMCTSLTAGAFCVDLPYGTVAVPIAGLLLSFKIDREPLLTIRTHLNPATRKQIDRCDSKVESAIRIVLF